VENELLDMMGLSVSTVNKRELREDLLLLSNLNIVSDEERG